jgi:hypothetical protein
LTRETIIPVMAALAPRLSGGGRPLVVMAALVAAIHVFDAASKDVDGRRIPGTRPRTWAGHDDEKAPVPFTNF